MTERSSRVESSGPIVVSLDRRKSPKIIRVFGVESSSSPQKSTLTGFPSCSAELRMQVQRSPRESNRELLVRSRPDHCHQKCVES